MPGKHLILVGCVAAAAGLAQAQSPASNAAGTKPAVVTPNAATANLAGSPSDPVGANGLAPYQLRLANATSVKVQTDILGVELGSTLKQAHARLDKLSDRAHPVKEEREEGEGEEGKVLWQLAGTSYSAIFIKTDRDEKVHSITAMLRPGREIPFAKIGDVKKAPMRDDHAIVWDVVRANRPLFRVTAKGNNSKADTISLFVVDRPEAETGEGVRPKS